MFNNGIYDRFDRETMVVEFLVLPRSFGRRFTETCLQGGYWVGVMNRKNWGILGWFPRRSRFFLHLTMSLYKNKYRIESARLTGWDYSGNGCYFVTICTRNRQCFFGTVIKGQMQLSAIGRIVAEEWGKTAEIRSSIELDQWVIMPNHFHAIVILKSESTGAKTSYPPISNGLPQLKSNSLGALVGQFKSACTRRIWAMGHQEFAWQPRFHDRIIRDEIAFGRVQDYIANNPKKWGRGRHHPFSIDRKLL